MKAKLLILVVFFFMILVNSYAQDIPKGCNTILIQGTCFDSVVNKVLDNGFFLQAKDTSTKTLTTMPKYWEGGFSGNIIINVRVKDSTAYISGLYNVNVHSGDLDLRDYTPIISTKGKGAFRSLPWEAMNNLATSIRGKVSYQKL